MPVCPVCGQKSQKLGTLCSCTKAYTIHDGQPKDPLKLLGKLVGGKLVPVGIYAEGASVMYYEAWQSAVERMVTFIVLKPELCRNENVKSRMLKVVNDYSMVHQQNLPMVFEELEVANDMPAILCDVRRGESLIDFLEQAQPDDVLVVHIIHQILQAMAAYHSRGVCFPNLCYEHVNIVQSGGDEAFVKLIGALDSVISTDEENISTADDVWCIGQLALSLLTGQPIPITNVELDEERAYLMSIVQLFMRATAPLEERYKNAGEVLVDFETILDVHPKGPTINVSKDVVDDARVGQKNQKKNNVDFNQIIWMHRPPYIEEG